MAILLSPITFRLLRLKQLIGESELLCIRIETNNSQIVGPLLNRTSHVTNVTYEFLVSEFNRSALRFPPLSSDLEQMAGRWFL
jgi:hypothetical protein